jgi:hypothetical protein
MTTTAPGTLAHTTTTPARRELGWTAAAGALPYLTLKVAWLTGHPVGADPDLLADPSVTVLNAVTLALDLVVVVLALALTHPWGYRLPGWTLLLPAWVGTGFLLPIALLVLPAVVVAGGAPASGGGPLEPWVQPVVYGGFAWQGVLLLAAFLLHARDRWAGTLAAAGGPVTPLLRVLATGGAAAAGVSALLHLGPVSGSATPSPSWCRWGRPRSRRPGPPGCWHSSAGRSPGPGPGPRGPAPPPCSPGACGTAQWS